MDGTNLTILVALAAGVISFLSPCVLPLVPAYLGQLTAIAVAGSAPGATPSRWLAVRHALAYVAGFGAVFTGSPVCASKRPAVTNARQYLIMKCSWSCSGS